MSHANITLPITVEHWLLLKDLVPRSLKEIAKDPETALYTYRPDPKAKLLGPYDPWKLRDEFLSWPLDDWDVFASTVGYFGEPFISKMRFGLWQKLLREALIRPAREWKALESEIGLRGLTDQLTGPLKIGFVWDGNTPRALIRSKAVLRTIIATIQIDKLTGAQFKVCARYDCNNPPFRVEARHKIFCSPECAHLVAVRNSRQRAAEAKLRTQKMAQSKRKGAKQNAKS